MLYRDNPYTEKANRQFINQAMSEPLLSREKEISLAKEWLGKENVSALHALVLPHTRLSVSIAGRYRAYGLPMGDLVQEGNVGLMQAAMRYDPDRNVRFSTYAAWWIKAAVQDYILRNWSIVRTGTTSAQKTLFFNLRRLRSQIQSQTGEETLTQENREAIAHTLDVTVPEVESMERRMSGPDQSLNVPMSLESYESRQDLIMDIRPSPEMLVAEYRDGRVRSQWLHEALGLLNAREKNIIKQRRLVDDTATLEDVGHTMGISKERVRQLEARALAKLRETLLHRTAETADFF